MPAGVWTQIPLINSRTRIRPQRPLSKLQTCARPKPVIESDTISIPSDFSEGFVVKNPKAMVICEIMRMEKKMPIAARITLVNACVLFIFGPFYGRR